jgi:hypothetical protein
MSMRMTTTAELGGEHQSFTIVGDGLTDLETGDGVMKMNIDGYEGLGDVKGYDAMSDAGSVEIRIVDGAGYMKLPAALGTMFGNGKWLKMPDLGVADSTMPGLGQSDPSKFLAYLETVSNGVKKVGTEEIRGVDTTHYSATLDLGQAVSRADVPHGLRDKLSDLFDNKAGFSAVPADVWVDREGITRRIKMQMDLGALVKDIAGAVPDAPKPEAIPDMTMTMSMDLYDFGVPVNVVAPPASETTEFPSFGPSGPSGAGFGSGYGNPNNA